MTPMNHADAGAIHGADSTLNLRWLKKESDRRKRWEIRHLTFNQGPFNHINLKPIRGFNC
jgi:hypothetical protein